MLDLIFGAWSFFLAFSILTVEDGNLFSFFPLAIRGIDASIVNCLASWEKKPEKTTTLTMANFMRLFEILSAYSLSHNNVGYYRLLAQAHFAYFRWMCAFFYVL